jgi:hypothetical protein
MDKRHVFVFPLFLLWSEAAVLLVDILSDQLQFEHYVIQNNVYLGFEERLPPPSICATLFAFWSSFFCWLENKFNSSFSLLMLKFYLHNN